MEHQTETDIEYDLDLDSRKLVFVFFGFLVICGAFFVAGYVLGNRTVTPSANYADVGVAGNTGVKDIPGVETSGRMNEVVKEPASPPSAVIESPPRVLESAAVAVVPDVIPPPVSVPPATVDKPGQQQKETTNEAVRTTAPATIPSAKQAASSESFYSVQVAAFRARLEAETKAKELEAGGFEYRIELPQSSNDFYRLRVGRFATRAEAREMENRLRKSGFETMITESKGN